MKKILLLAGASIFFLSACKTAKLTPFADDAYTNPEEVRLLAKHAEEERAKQIAIEKQKQEELAAQEKAKEAANPYYKDPVYSADDYYDYAYAARINRFSTPIIGAAYYDPYYTNYYSYCQNSAYYGTSIYSTYSYWSPYNSYGYFSYGPLISNNIYFGYQPNVYWGTGWNNNCNYSYWNSCYSGWNSCYSGYGCNNGYNSYGYYNGYNNYYGGGYHNGWNNNNWGYYNGSDPNSGYSKMQFGQRGADGGNDQQARSGNVGVAVANPDNGRQKYFESVAQQQASNPRFTEGVGQRANQTRSGGNTSEQTRNSDSRSIDPRSTNGQVNNDYYNQGRTNNTNKGGGYNPQRGDNANGGGRGQTVEHSNNNSGGGFPNIGTRVTQTQSSDNANHNSSGNSNRSSGGGSGGGSTNSGDSGSRGGGSSGGGSRPR
ncbi:MAG: hypothetical protein IT236_10880 [Bacteroidia bacterium]|nr:hypothetical protein [Bacteroidia bacterium]